MDLDQSPTSQQTAQTPSSEAPMRTVRTPLPSGPRLERTAQAAISLPSIDDTYRSNLQSHASSIIANPNRGRYSAVHALLLTWADEQDVAAKQSVEELRLVLDRHYNYTLEMEDIPTNDPVGPRKWLKRRIDQFMDANDQRDVLKIFYYNGRTQLDENRAMVLTRYVQIFGACRQAAACSAIPEVTSVVLQAFSHASLLPFRIQALPETVPLS